MGASGTRVAGPQTSVGSTVDSDDYEMVVGNLPEHDHGAGDFRTDFDDGHVHTFPYINRAASGRIISGTGNRGSTGIAGGHDHTLTGQSADAGGTEPLDMQQPSIKVMALMKT